MLQPVRAGNAEGNRTFGQAQSCIFIYLFGGPSHIDIWDLKPNAPAEIRGEFRPRATNVPGVSITEHLPRLAQHADKYAIVRSLTHGDPAHGSAGHAMMTGRRMRQGDLPPSPDDCPHYGAVLARLRPAPHAVTPFVSLPQVVATSTNVVPGQNAGFLGRALDPLRLERPANDSLLFAAPLPSVSSEGAHRRLGQRVQLLQQLEAQGRLGRDPCASEMSKLYQQAFQCLDSPKTAAAFCLDREPAKLRERYGWNVFGQSLLLARRLAEAGVRMIMVCWPERTEPEAYLVNGVRDRAPVPLWDMHGWNVGNTAIFPTLKEKALPPLDVAVSALLEDLTVRGLLNQTLVVVTGEFGRAPRVDPKLRGRDHYGHVFSGMLAGGGIRGGQVYGASDQHGAFPALHPVVPEDFAATLYHCLGVAPDAEIVDRLGRPQKVTAEGKPIRGLLG
ncbi:MAG: DUF1501 domain-containing protein [Planctomycetes bacterium]|nr:DUF1501 domain-containing protein [Planctomycetota bacterium]